MDTKKRNEPLDYLEEIMAFKRSQFKDSGPVDPAKLKAVARSGKQIGAFRDALRTDHLSVIAEFKRTSPSCSWPALHKDPTLQTARYIDGGADAVSILTDSYRFDGCLRDLEDSVNFIEETDPCYPFLCKDFMVHPLQVLRAAKAGAACIFIIVRALNDDQIRSLTDAAAHANLESIFEVYDEVDLFRALAFSAAMISVNNRDLRTLKTDLSVSEALIPMIPAYIGRISASGISTVEDARRVRAAGADAVLVGHALMHLPVPRMKSLIRRFQQV